MGNNVLILFDLEGISGVEKLYPISSALNLAYKEITLVGSMLVAVGFKKIYLCNIHNSGRDLDKSKLDNLNIILLEGINELLENTSKFDFAILIGFHGKRKSGGRFDHTFRYDFVSITFDGLNLGEVGMYTRFLISENIPVIFVSGEGCFKDEVEMLGIPTISSQIDPESYKKEINKAIMRELPALCNIPQSSVIVTIDNTDKYHLLRDYPYYNKIGNYFCLDSIKCFFKNLYTFSTLLNYAGKIIYDENVKFINTIKKTISNEIKLMEIISEYGRLTMLQMEQRIRNEIAERLDINYETDFNIKKVL